MGYFIFSQFFVQVITKWCYEKNDNNTGGRDLPYFIASRYERQFWFSFVVGFFSAWSPIWLRQATILAPMEVGICEFYRRIRGNDCIIAQSWGVLDDYPSFSPLFAPGKYFLSIVGFGDKVSWILRITGDQNICRNSAGIVHKDSTDPGGFCCCWLADLKKRKDKF